MNDYVTENLNDLTRRLAYKNWERRGRPLGSPEMDWIAAESALASSRAYSRQDFSLFGLSLEPNEEAYR